MRGVLLEATAAAGGVISRADALRLVAHHVLEDAVRNGALARPFPQTFALPELVTDRRVLRRAALVYRPDASLSHLDALSEWLPTIWRQPANAPVHLTCPPTTSNKATQGVTLHRRAGFSTQPPTTMVRGGLRLVRLEQAIVESWPLLPAVDRRTRAIVAVRDRRTTGGRLAETLRRNPQQAGATEMRRLFGLLSLGVRSELELWGHEGVFDDPRLPVARLQVKVTLSSGRNVYLDRLYDEGMVDVELDGAAYHGLPGQRERDLRRDAALARLGYLTVRFSHLRLVSEPEDVVAELLDILAVRRRQLTARPA